MNNKTQSTLNNNSDKNVDDTKNKKSINCTSGCGLSMKQMMEAMSAIIESMDNPLPDQSIDKEEVEEKTLAPIDQEGEQELLDQLNQIFTPILVMQGFETGIADKIQEAFSEASVLMERNIISFDDKSRMAQLISACSLLIAQKKGDPKFEMYRNAAAVRNKMKLDIQKDHYDDAKALAQKFLVKVSTTNNSSFARDAAQNLLPETQH